MSREIALVDRALGVNVVRHCSGRGSLRVVLSVIFIRRATGDWTRVEKSGRHIVVVSSLFEARPPPRGRSPAAGAGGNITTVQFLGWGTDTLYIGAINCEGAYETHRPALVFRGHLVIFFPNNTVHVMLVTKIQILPIFSMFTVHCHTCEKTQEK